jgi:hypothetical protein
VFCVLGNIKGASFQAEPVMCIICHVRILSYYIIVYIFLVINIFFLYMDVVTRGRNCPVNFNKHTL